MIERPRVVITGMGAITPLGLNVEDTWKRAIAGECGISSFGDIENRPYKGIAVAGQVKDFNLEDYVIKKNHRRVHRSAGFALAATVEALRDAGLLEGSSKADWKLANVDPTRVGLRIGTGVGGSAYAAVAEGKIRDEGESGIDSTDILQMLPERVDTVTSMALGIKGPGAALVAACATGSESIADAARLIMLGEADVVIAGGTEAALNRISIGAFAAMRALSTNEDPEKACRPFDKEANGFIMGEGAGIVVLESEDFAIRRGAPQIHAVLRGYADTLDADHDTAPSGEGAQRAMRLSLTRAGLSTSDIDYIKTHGTSTQKGDPAELEAIKAVFGEDIYRIAINSPKSLIGHLLGAAGGIETVIAIMAIKTGIIPPTRNLNNPIDAAAGLNLVPLVAQYKEVNNVICNSFGFGGINSVLALSKYQG